MEASELHMSMFAGQHERIEAVFNQARLSGKMPDPVVLVLDLRDREGQYLARHNRRNIDDLIHQAAKAGDGIPILVWALPRSLALRMLSRAFPYADEMLLLGEEKDYAVFLVGGSALSIRSRDPECEPLFN